MKVQYKLLLILFISILTLSSCASLKGCDCPGLGQKVNISSDTNA